MGKLTRSFPPRLPRGAMLAAVAMRALPNTLIGAARSTYKSTTCMLRAARSESLTEVIQQIANYLALIFCHQAPQRQA